VVQLLGGPAAVVPVCRSTEGLPIGVQIAGVRSPMSWCWRSPRLVESEFGYQPPPMAL